MRIENSSVATLISLCLLLSPADAFFPPKCHNSKILACGNFNKRDDSEIHARNLGVAIKGGIAITKVVNLGGDKFEVSADFELDKSIQIGKALGPNVKSIGISGTGSGDVSLSVDKLFDVGKWSKSFTITAEKNFGKCCLPKGLSIVYDLLEDKLAAEQDILNGFKSILGDKINYVVGAADQKMVEFDSNEAIQKQIGSEDTVSLDKSLSVDKKIALSKSLSVAGISLDKKISLAKHFGLTLDKSLHARFDKSIDVDAFLDKSIGPDGYHKSTGLDFDKSIGVGKRDIGLILDLLQGILTTKKELLNFCWDCDCDKPLDSSTLVSSTTSSAPPTSSTPASSTPASSTPASSTPASSVPESSTPSSSVPASSVPESSTPASSVPASSVPESSAPASSVPASSVPASSVPASSVPASSVPASSSSVPSSSKPSSSGPISSAQSSVVTASTVTSTGTTVVTITSCSDHICTVIPKTTGVVTVTSESTTYTTYCPLTTTASTSTATVVPHYSKEIDTTSTATELSTAVITVTTCEDNKCTAVPVTTGVTTVTSDYTTYTTYCPLTSSAVTVVPPAESHGAHTASTVTVIPPAESHGVQTNSETTVVPPASLAPQSSAATGVPTVPTVSAHEGAGAINEFPFVTLMAAIGLFFI